MSVLHSWIDGLTHEQAKEELKRLHAKYEDREKAMRDTGAIVRSLYVCSRCGKRILIIGEGYCHCTRAR